MFRKLIYLLGVLLWLTGIASAQDVLPLDQLVIGEITAANPTPTYHISPVSGQTLSIEVTAVTSGLAPEFVIATSAAGQRVSNPNRTDDLKTVATFVQGGDYAIVVSSASGMTGQFVIRVSSAASAPAAPSLQNGQPVSGSLASGQTITYTLMGGSSPLMLTVEGSVSVTLQNAAGETTGLTTSALEGGAFYLPPGIQTYQLMLSNETGAASVNYTAALNPRTGQSNPVVVTPTSVLATPATSEPTEIPLPVLPTTGACVLATLRPIYVNVRTGPSTDFDRVANLDPQQTYPVIGRSADGSWYQVDFGGGNGWVALFVARTGGDCSNLPVTYTPPTVAPPTSAPTQSSARIAGDNEWRGVQLPFERGFSVGHSGAISYPNGDRQDTISYNIIQVPSTIPSDAQFRYRIRCTGDTQYATVQFSDGSTRDCTPDGSNYTTYFNSNTSRLGSFTIAMTGGDNAYVEWDVQFSWYIP